MVSMVSVVAISLAFTSAFLVLSFYRFEPVRIRSFSVAAIGLVTIALAVRLVVAYNSVGFSSDVACFQGWGRLVHSVGMKEMYSQDVFLDYPPGYVTVLWFVEAVAGLLGRRGYPVYDLLYHLPSILADIVCGVTLMLLARKRSCDSKAIFIGAAYLFCPATIIASAQWGQVDSFCTMFLLFSVLCLYDGRYAACGILYGLSAICKPQMFAFVPLYLFFVLKRRDWKACAKGLVSGAAAMALVALPYTKGFDFTWLVDNYRNCMDGYNYYSVNAYNIWTVLGMNWRTLPEDTTLLTVAAPVAAVVLCGLFFLSRRKDVVFAAPVVLMAIVFMFGIKQHERYLFPVLAFTLLVYVVTDDVRHFHAFLLSNLCVYLNVGHVFSLFRDGHWLNDMNSVSAKALSTFVLCSLSCIIVSYAWSYLDLKSVFGRFVHVWKDKGIVRVERGCLQEDTEG